MIVPTVLFGIVFATCLWFAYLTKGRFWLVSSFIIASVLLILGPPNFLFGGAFATMFVLMITVYIARKFQLRPRWFAASCLGGLLLFWSSQVLLYIPVYWEHQRLIAAYPLEDLTPRLAYERHVALDLATTDGHARSDSSSHAEGVAIDAKRLEALDKTMPRYSSRIHSSWWGRNRKLALNALSDIHSGFVADFIEQPGFGIDRMNLRVVVREQHIVLPTPEPIPQPPPMPTPSDSVADSTNQPLPSMHSVAISKNANLRLPEYEFESPTQFNLGKVLDFVPAESLGYINQKREVRGFQSHAFQEMSRDLKLKNTDFRWKLEKLELISLLKHQAPVAYRSNNLPSMDELRNAPTRPLNAFEEQAIVTLRKGEEIVVDSWHNEMRMVGSIRAAKKCLECHHVQHGGLLGAFTYRFYRDPLLPEPAPQKGTL